MDTLTLASLCIVMDSTVSVLIGIIKGIGMQVQATCAYFVCFYLIGVPASYYFCFILSFGLRGLWTGLFCGLLILVCSLAYIIRKSNWSKIAHEARLKYDSSPCALSQMIPLFEESRHSCCSSRDSECQICGDQRLPSYCSQIEERPFTSFKALSPSKIRDCIELQ